jgi:hypothetical protein
MLPTKPPGPSPSTLTLLWVQGKHIVGWVSHQQSWRLSLGLAAAITAVSDWVHGLENLILNSNLTQFFQLIIGCMGSLELIKQKATVSAMMLV